MNILVTGGAGFIGSHLCDRLLQDGHEVLCLDDFSTGARTNLREHPRLTVWEFDVRESLEDLIRMDAIFNLASPAAPVTYLKNPVQTIGTVLQGIHNALELASIWSIPIVQASTSEVYGEPTTHPQCETHWGNVNPIGPRSCYAEAKRAAEAMCYAYQRQYGTRVKVARIFNTYGPRMSRTDGRVIPNFITRTLQGKPLELYGGGGQTRAFCYVDDIVEGLVRMLSRDFEGPVNLGHPVETSIHTLAKMVQGLMGVQVGETINPMPEDDPNRRCPRVRKAEQVLGWTPQVSLQEGLLRTIEYYRTPTIPGV